VNIANNILKRSLQNVYFFVGTACGGKTTMGRELSKKYGFTYFSDNWNEPNWKEWESIIDETYQPYSHNRGKSLSTEEYFSRSIEDFDFLLEISDYSRIACLLTSGDLIIRDYYQRDDHIDFTRAIQSLENSEQKFEVQNELFRIGAKEIAKKAAKHKLFSIMRNEESTIEKTLLLLENHFGLSAFMQGGAP